MAFNHAKSHYILEHWRMKISYKIIFLLKWLLCQHKRYILPLVPYPIFFICWTLVTCRASMYCRNCIFYYEVPFTANPLRNLDDAAKTSLFRFLILRNTLVLVYVKCFLCGDDHGIYWAWMTWANMLWNVSAFSCLNLWI